ncbi:GntR family transcriptional regulator [Alicyclobacillus fastidiosus]|uniref:GntR family transcriptional regulator n=1 Tax=Alicyclobacillus fastidiosus TaxID=392011 RepID=A0ABY6ZFE9_9BACL|nr:GntR family transcriptional regulator [Alicyclobacillus fastidiosus]WAH41298.1 GntR family transcriptional regulator [Alicyclobacillus fastidiosus]GMA62899.1 LacI family transcriptional regulator [Alicyclobacillus fastidiosus]
MNTNVSKASKASKYQKVYQYLCNEIAFGTYKPGDMIPTEEELTKQFNVSRVTTNRALQLLVNEGIIERKAGIGTFVSKQNERTKTSGMESNVSSIGKQVHKIGLVLPFLSSIYGHTILTELERLCSDHDMVLTVACSYADQEKEKVAINRLVDSGVDGLVVFPVNGDYYNEALLKLHVEKFPLVLIDKNLQGIPFSCVSTNNRKASYELTSYLISLNHEEIAFVMPHSNFTSSLIERLDGYRLALTEANISIREEYILSGVETVNVTNDQVDNRYIKILEPFLRDYPQITAVVATDDAIAQNILQAANAIGKHVPDDLSIVCFDGPAPRWNSWNFTHMVQDETGMATKTFEILNELMRRDTRDAAPLHIELEASFYLGESTAERR